MEDQADIKRSADKSLAKSAWALVWNRKAPLWAALGIAAVFFIRSTFCSYQTDIPEGLDFEWYGNHCGPGYGDPEVPAIDELDAACKRHDAEYRRLAVEKEASPPIKE